ELGMRFGIKKMGDGVSFLFFPFFIVRGKHISNGLVPFSCEDVSWQPRDLDRWINEFVGNSLLLAQICGCGLRDLELIDL
ncbi:hypothetical protein ACJX0J_008205, partial [Zea mays]